MYSETIRVQKRYDRFARFYDAVEFLIERKLFKKLRKETLNKLQGKILDIGIGTGKNLPYYNAKAEVTGIDISRKMLEKAKKKAKTLGIKVKIHLMDAQSLKFKDNSFDYVIGTFVLCSIPDPVKAASEMKRVVKKNGKIILVEHVLSKYWPIALWENIHNPVTKRLFGFNVNRDTKQNIIKSGLHVNKDERLAFFDVFRRFTCTKSLRR